MTAILVIQSDVDRGRFFFVCICQALGEGCLLGEHFHKCSPLALPPTYFTAASETI